MENIRVYVYTAVNGYAWQGCGESLSASLSACVDALGLPEGHGSAEAPLGGVIRWKVAGENGTAVLRVHVRKSGDFRGRDSRYVALAFLPFRVTREHPADYRRLWAHPLLAAPRPDPLEGLGFDYAEDLWLQGGVADGGEYWTTDVDRVCPPNGSDGVLLDLARMFQSRTTELGALSAIVRGEVSEGLSASLSYKALPEVAGALRAAGAYKEALEGDSTTKSEMDSARTAWRQALDALFARVGRMPDFDGLADFARSAEAAFCSHRWSIRLYHPALRKSAGSDLRRKKYRLPAQEPLISKHWRT